ncbi:MAG: nucleotidyl transferase AbiEii/AbiGii toxin family protein [Prevotellaceae bacterium]|nr:nucleotidyl transferase AbiEii/AbiGii toxin family protein [Prevotellaceae bacterium]
MLHTFTVKESTLLLLKKLQAIPFFSEMRLVGGTALALQLGHRNSVDLDFFGKMNFTRGELEHELQKNGLKTSVRSESELIKITQIENIKVDFVDYSSVIWLEQAVLSDGICLAGLKDIGAMKISAIIGRGTKKDFIDLFFLLQYFSLEQLIDFYKQKYDTNSIFHIIRSLTYFEDAEEDPQPEMYVPFEWNKAKQTIKQAVAAL